MFCKCKFHCSKCVKPIKSKTMIKVALDSGQEKSTVVTSPIVSAFFQEDLSLTVAYGRVELLTFEEVVSKRF